MLCFRGLVTGAYSGAGMPDSNRVVDLMIFYKYLFGAQGYERIMHELAGSEFHYPPA